MFFQNISVKEQIDSSVDRNNSNFKQGFQSENIKYSKEKIGFKKRSLLLKRSNSKQVLLSFWNEFNDTLVIYINNKLIDRRPIFSDTTTCDSFKTINIYLNAVKPMMIRVELLRKRKFVEFVIDNEAPMVTVQRYNEIWYVKYRYYSTSVSVNHP